MVQLTTVRRYGQMTAGSYCYIGPQGIVHGTTVSGTLLIILRLYTKMGVSEHCSSNDFLTDRTSNTAVGSKTVPRPPTRRRPIQWRLLRRVLELRKSFSHVGSKDRIDCSYSQSQNIDSRSL